MFDHLSYLLENSSVGLGGDMPFFSPGIVHSFVKKKKKILQHICMNPQKYGLLLADFRFIISKLAHI